MFTLFKRQISPQECGHQWWLFCCNCADKFCMNYRPKLKAAGYLQNPTADRLFMDEAMRLHLWIISRSLGAADREVLDVMHNHAHGLTIVNGKTFPELYAIYDKAASKEMELQDAGLRQPVLAMTVIQYLVNDKAHSEVVIAMEIHIDIDIVINAVRKTRSEFKIRKS
jgi:hypothetical protein